MYDNRTDPRYPRMPGEVCKLDDARRVVDGYDTGIRYVDDHIGQILQALASEGIRDDDVAVIISSDHGENLGKFGIYAEHATADEPTTRIPLIVKWPGGIRGHVDASLHYGLDVAPTLADLLGIAPPCRLGGEKRRTDRLARTGAGMAAPCTQSVRARLPTRCSLGKLSL